MILGSDHIISVIHPIECSIALKILLATKIQGRSERRLRDCLSTFAFRCQLVDFRTRRAGPVVMTYSCGSSRPEHIRLSKEREKSELWAVSPLKPDPSPSSRLARQTVLNDIMGCPPNPGLTGVVNEAVMSSTDGIKAQHFSFFPGISVGKELSLY